VATVTLEASLIDILAPDRVSARGADRDQHSRDDSRNPAVLPDLVVWPETTGEVSAIARLACETRTPITAWGRRRAPAGTPSLGGIVIDFQRMNRIVEIDPANFQAVVEPGVLRLDLEPSSPAAACSSHPRSRHHHRRDGGQQRRRDQGAPLGEPPPRREGDRPGRDRFG
jgi:hypothetical protein